MAVLRSGSKGFDLEETLKAYFWRAGYFVVRGVPYQLDGDDITDVDLWLYERPAALTRRRLIVDIKNKRTPKVAERIIWTKGLQSALAVDGSIVATTDKRASARRLSKALGITLLDGDALNKLSQSAQLKNANQLRSEDFDRLVRQVDSSRRSNDWRLQVLDARTSLLSGLGVQSANKTLGASAYFAEQAALAQPRSEQARIALRLFYHASALAAISLDFMLADQVFRSPEDRRNSIIGSIRFGETGSNSVLPAIQAAIGLARKYADNGSATAKQIEYGFMADADRIPAEIIADYIVRGSTFDSLFNVAREIEYASTTEQLPSFDQLSVEAKSLLGVFLDFNGISREKLAQASSPSGKIAVTARKPQESTEAPGPLFSQELDSKAENAEENEPIKGADKPAD